MDCLIGGIAVFTLDLVNDGRFKVKHVAKLSSLGARFPGDFAQSFIVQHRWK